MFDNIGGKIKGLAMMFCWIGILSCIFVGIAIILIDENLVPVGLIVALAGSFFPGLVLFCYTVLDNWLKTVILLRIKVKLQ